MSFPLILRIESHEFGARILGGELPINASLFDIASLCPGSCPTVECFQIQDAPVQALLGKQAQFNSSVKCTIYFPSLGLPPD